MTDLDLTVDGRRHGIDVLILDGDGSRWTVPPPAARRARRWAARVGATLHTVVLDERDQTAPAAYSGHRLWYRRGVGSAGLDSSIRVRDAAHLRALVRMTARQVARLGRSR